MRFIALSLLFFTITFVIQAQSEEAETWPVVEHCVSEPTTPPDDWSFEGIIFLSGSIGIHGLSSNISTLYIIAFNDYYNTFAYSGALSPNGEWLAVPEGSRERTNTVNYVYNINEGCA